MESPNNKWIYCVNYLTSWILSNRGKFCLEFLGCIHNYMKVAIDGTNILCDCTFAEMRILPKLKRGYQTIR